MSVYRHMENQENKPKAETVTVNADSKTKKEEHKKEEPAKTEK